MGPLQLQVRIGSSEACDVEIDEEETVLDLAVLVMSLRPDLCSEEELPKLIHRGIILKHEQVIKDIGITPGGFVVAVPAKRPAAGAEAAPAVVAASSQPAAAPAGAVPSHAPPTGAPVASVAPDTPAGQPTEDIITTLCGMGFDRGKVIEALAAAFNNPDRAVDYLFNGIPAAVAAAPGIAVPAAAAQGTPGGHWAETMLGPQLLTCSQGSLPTQQALNGAAVVALYFSAHWCPPCRQFTPRLAAALAQNAWPQMAVVFVSSDRDAGSFLQYFAEMPWLALPFESPARQLLGATFQVRGIPSLVVLDAQTGRQLSADGRGDVMRLNFDIGACLRSWGVVAQPSAPAVASTAPPPAAAPAAPPKKVGPPPLPIDEEAAQAALHRVTAEPWEVQENFFKTALKVLDNALQNPEELKFRQLKRSNATLNSKLLTVARDAGEALLGLAGFQPGQASDGSEALTLEQPPDGRCTAVRDRLQTAANAAWEKHAREERDARIKEEREKDKARQTRYSGGEGGGGRMDLGRGRGPARGGG